MAIPQWVGLKDTAEIRKALWVVINVAGIQLQHVLMFVVAYRC